MGVEARPRNPLIHLRGYVLDRRKKENAHACNVPLLVKFDELVADCRRSEHSQVGEEQRDVLGRSVIAFWGMKLDACRVKQTRGC